VSNVTGLPAGGFDEAEETITSAVAGERADLGTARREALWTLILRSRNVVATAVAAILFAYFSLATAQFLSVDNLFNVLRNLSYIGIVAVGMTFLFVVGELALSGGAMFGLLTVIMGVLVVRNGISPWIGMLAVVVLGMGIGGANGLIVTKLGIPAFIVTIGGLTAFRSLGLIISGQEPSAAVVEGDFYNYTGGYVEGTIPYLVVWMAAIMLIGGVILAYTRFGYHVYATGGSVEAARNSGVDTDRVKLACFMLTGALCGLVAALIFGYLHVAAPTTGTGFEFRVIGAAIVGGVALTGGRGSIYGTFIGAIIIGIITNGLVHLGYSQYLGDVATGLLIAVAGLMDISVRHAAARGLRAIEG
jgi:ribose transport system permease protein